MIKRPYFVGFDGTGDIPVPNQLDDPINERFIPNIAANPRSILGNDLNVYAVADQTVVPRGSKNIIWSSEGYTSLGNNLTAVPPAGIGTVAAVPNAQAYNGVTIPALTATQKKTTGSTGSATTGNIGTLLGATPPVLDLSPYRNILLVINLISFTAGSTPSFLPEFDLLDDAATPLSIAIFKPSAVTTATTWIVNIGPNQPFLQSVTTAAVTPLSATVTAFSAIASTTYVPIPIDFPPNGQFQWTIANTPTACAWTAFIYGKY